MLKLEEVLQDEISRLRNADAFRDNALLDKLAVPFGIPREAVWGIMLGVFEAVADRLEYAVDRLEEQL